MPRFQNESSMQDFSHKNEFGCHENEPVGETHLHKNCFTRRLVFDTEAKGNSEMAYSNNRFEWETVQLGELKNWTYFCKLYYN